MELKLLCSRRPRPRPPCLRLLPRSFVSICHHRLPPGLRLRRGRRRCPFRQQQHNVARPSIVTHSSLARPRPSSTRPSVRPSHGPLIEGHRHRRRRAAAAAESSTRFPVLSFILAFRSAAGPRRPEAGRASLLPRGLMRKGRAREGRATWYRERS